jgi:hypothetical protein
MRRSRWAILWAVVLILGGLGALFLLDFLTAPGDDWWVLSPAA